MVTEGKKQQQKTNNNNYNIIIAENIPRASAVLQ